VILAPEDFYRAANLKTNPFRSNPSTISDPRADIWVGYEKEQRVLVKFVTRTRSDQVGNTNFIVLHGDYGTGKSHALLWLQNLILIADKGEFNASCYFIPTLKKAKGALTFAGAFIADLLAKSTLVADVQDFRTFLGSCIFRYRDQESVPSQVKDLELVERLIPAVELFFPFDEGAIDAIASQLTEITPRLVVNTMQQVIEDVRLGGIDPAAGFITLDVLDQLDILDEIIQQGRTS